MRSLAERTKGKGASEPVSDRTNYGHTRISARMFLDRAPHAAHLARGAVMYDAMAIRKRLLANTLGWRTY